MRPLHPARLLLLGFAGLILIGAVLLWLPVSSSEHMHTSFLTAVFTATSAICVTGLAVVQTSTHWSIFGQVVLMLLMQIGGLGVMTTSAAIYLLLGLRIRLSQRIALQESLNVIELSGIVRLALRILLLTAAAELVGATLLAIGFWPTYHLHAVFVGVFQAISAFNNAGFDVTGHSLVPWQRSPLIILVHALLIIAGGLGYGVLLDLGLRLRGRRPPLSLHVRWVLTFTGVLILAGTIVFAAIGWNDPRTFGHLAAGYKLLNAFFQSVTARTAGFNSVPITQMHPASLFFLMILMFIGASPGGTGGGIKTTTFAVIIAGVYSVISQNSSIEAHGRTISWEFFSRAMSIAVLSAALIVAMTAGVLLADHATFLQALFETISAFGTVGLDLNLTPHLTALGRVLIMLTMYIGRVGPLTAAVALAYRSKTLASIRYPEAKIPIG